MPKALSTQERLAQGKDTMKELEQVINSIMSGNLDGQERGRAYRHANSLCLAITRAVHKVRSRPKALGASQGQVDEAEKLIAKAERLYDDAWAQYHPRRG